MKKGDAIRRAREKAGLTQSQLAAKLKVSQAMITQYENDKRFPKYETLEKIAYVLNIPVMDLVDPKTTNLVNDVVDLFTGASSLRVDFQQTHLNELFISLNSAGKDKAIEQMELLAKIPEYRNDSNL